MAKAMALAMSMRMALTMAAAVAVAHKLTPVKGPTAVREEGDLMIGQV